MRLPALYMLTCPSRQAKAEETLHRWMETDWGSGPDMLLDAEPEIPGREWGTTGHCARLTSVFRRGLEQALEDSGRDDDWMLFLQDDLEFHPRIGSLLRSWPALEDLRCGMASLSDPSLHPTLMWGEMKRAFAAQAGTYRGTQALLLRRWAAELAVAEWETVAGIHSHRLAKLLGPLGPIWVHQPALAQHVGEDVSWGMGISRTSDLEASLSG